MKTSMFVERLIHEQSFRLMSHASIVSITDLKGIILFANENFAKISGYTVKELVGKNHNIINSGLHPRSFWAAMWKTITHGGIWREEVRNKRKDESYYWVDTQIMPCLDEHGNVNALLSIRNDITKRKLAEEKFELTNANLKALIESMPDAIFFKDGDSRWLVTNAVAKKLFALQGFDWLGKTEMELARARPAFKAAHEKCFIDDEKAWSEKKLTVFTEFIEDENKNIREYEVRKVPLFNTDGSRKALIIVGTDVTERRQAEQTILESRQRFRAMADSAPVLLWMSDTDKQCYYFNKVWHEFTGRTLKQEMGNGWTEGVHTDDLHRCLEIYTHHFDLRKSFTMEYRLRRHDGQYRWISDHGVPRYLPNGEFVGFIGSCIDITKRRHAEIDLKRAKKSLEQTMRLAKIGGWEADFTNNTITWSGITREIAEVPDDFVPELSTILNFYKEGENRKKMEVAMQKTKQEGVGFEMELQLISAKGKEYWTRTIAEPKMVNGRCEKIYGYFQDITEQVELGKKNLEIERKFSHLIEKSTDAIVLQDVNGIVLYCSPAIENILGYTPLEAVGLNALTIFHEDDLQQVEVARKKILNAPGQSFPIAASRLKHKAGHYVQVEGTVTNLLHDEAVQAMVSNFRDVTDKRLTEEKLKLKNERLEEIAWLFSHEVRGPVATILGLVNLLNHSDKIDPINEEVLAKILIPVSSLDKIISKIVQQTYNIEAQASTLADEPAKHG